MHVAKDGELAWASRGGEGTRKGGARKEMREGKGAHTSCRVHACRGAAGGEGAGKARPDRKGSAAKGGHEGTKNHAHMRAEDAETKHTPSFLRAQGQATGAAERPARSLQRAG